MAKGAKETEEDLKEKDKKISTGAGQATKVIYFNYTVISWGCVWKKEQKQSILKLVHYLTNDSVISCQLQALLLSVGASFSERLSSLAS